MKDQSISGDHGLTRRNLLAAPLLAGLTRFLLPRSGMRLRPLSRAAFAPFVPVSLVPSEVLDLSSWKLNLPTDDQEVLPPQLAGFSDPAFQVAEAVAFTAECGGEAMPGSQYPRSELREMNPDGSNAYWSTTVGQHTMNLTQRITHLPVVKQQLVFAQIHGDPEYLILAEIDQQALYVRYRNSIAGVLDTRYQHGTFFSLSIRASGGYVDVFYNGIHKVHQPLIADGCYFKAGCYLQSNVEKGDLPTAYGQVEISQLTVTHS